MNKSTKTILIVLNILIIIAVAVSISYAYFTSQATKIGSGESTVFETGKMEITFTDTSLLTANNLKPGDSVSKTFTVTNTGTVTALYKIKFTNVENEFTRLADLVYEIKNSTGDTIVLESQFPATDTVVSPDISIGNNETQTYTITITYKAVDEEQNEDMNATASTTIQVISE